jgi:hypothetical protein
LSRRSSVEEVFVEKVVVTEVFCTGSEPMIAEPVQNR